MEDGISKVVILWKSIRSLMLPVTGPKLFNASWTDSSVSYFTFDLTLFGTKTSFLSGLILEMTKEYSMVDATEYSS